MRKLSIEEMRDIAFKRGGFCLSDEYINNNTKLRWRCRLGHEWMTSADHIKVGSWCPKCSSKIRALKKTKHSIEEMRRFAEGRGGKCLSNIYRNTDGLLKWQCNQGHTWEASVYAVTSKMNTWCPHCAKCAPLNIQLMKEMASKKGGQCLSQEYFNNSTKLLWRCKSGHEWMSVPNSIRQGLWCRVCSGKAKLTIEEMQNLAHKQGGKCLSTEYHNLRTKLQWQCKKGHEWWAIPHHIKDGHWCPVCLYYMCEEKVRSIFEEIFKKKFIKAHPKWLMGIKHRSLELDGYNEELGLAFEYHGEQHFHKDNYFYRLNKSKEGAFERYQDNDILKRKLCIGNSVTLIEIPYTIRPKDYRSYIIRQCKNNKIDI